MRKKVRPVKENEIEKIFDFTINSIYERSQYISENNSKNRQEIEQILEELRQYKECLQNGQVKEKTHKRIKKLLVKVEDIFSSSFLKKISYIMYQVENGIEEGISPYKRDISSIRATLREKRSDFEDIKGECERLKEELERKWKDWVKKTIPKLRWKAGWRGTQEMALTSSPLPEMSDMIDDIGDSKTFLFKRNGFRVEVSLSQIRLVNVNGRLEDFLVYIKNNDLKFRKEYE